MITRRQFFTRALATVPAVALAPSVIAELLEELAPTRTIILPPAQGWPELAEIVRRAFLPQMVLQIYKTNPLMRTLLENTGGANVVLPQHTRLAPGERRQDVVRYEFEG